MSKKIKALFPANPADWHGMDGEWIWVELDKDGSYKVLNIPLYSYGVSYMDKVLLNKSGNILNFDRVSFKGGNHTYRILLRSGFGKPDFDKRWAALAALGCEYESSKDPEDVFGINVPQQSDVQAVYALLEDGQNDGVWYFDEGNYEGP